MSKKFLQDQHGRLDILALNELSQSAVTHWIYTRLHGNDPHFPLDPQQSDYWHTLLSEAFTHSQISDEARRRIRLSVRDMTEDLAKYPHSQWKEAAAIEELLFLAPEILRDSEFEDQAVHFLQKMSGSLPYRDTNGIRLKGWALVALLSMHRPKEIDFWKQQWTPKFPDYAGLIFEGLELTSVEIAFTWFGSIQPWKAKELIPCLESLLPSLLAEYRPEKVKMWIEEKMLPSIKSETIRAKVREMCETKGLDIWEEFELPLDLLECCLECLVNYRKLGAETKPLIYCGGDDARFIRDILPAYANAKTEAEIPSSEMKKNEFMGLFMAHLRGKIPQERIEGDSRFEKVQNIDVGRNQIQIANLYDVAA